MKSMNKISENVTKEIDLIKMNQTEIMQIKCSVK